MNPYIITYDLVNEKNYRALIEKIKEYPDAAHVQESVWLVHYQEQEFGSREIRNNLKTVIDGDDNLFIAKLTGEAAWRFSIDDESSVREAL